MQCKRKGIVVALATVVLWSAAVSAWAQSGTRLDPPDEAARVPAEETRKEVSLALEGYCPVCIHGSRTWVKGSPDHWTIYDGRKYLFPGAEQKEVFLKNPQKFAPVLGGDCVVCLAKKGERVPGDIRHAAFYKGRLFLFPGKKQKEMFFAEPDAFVKTDLALQGNCPVCLTEMNQMVPGKPEWSIVHDGLRYWFPSGKQRDLFLRSPQKFTEITELRTAE